MRAIVTVAIAAIAAIVVTVGSLVDPASASAATASVRAGTVVFTAGAGEANRLSVRNLGGRKVRLQDAGAVIAPAGSGCVSPFPGAVDCTSSDPRRRVIVALRDGSDQLLVVGRRGVDVSAGNGHDAILGSRGNDILKGGKGKDVLNGRGGRDRLLGGAHGDVLVGRNGSDTIDGGKGNDQLGGGPGTDRLLGGPGVDRLNPGRDGRADRVSCGSGTDFALLRKRDRAKGCEFVKRVAVAGARR